MRRNDGRQVEPGVQDAQNVQRYRDNGQERAEQIIREAEAAHARVYDVAGRNNSQNDIEVAQNRTENQFNLDNKVQIQQMVESGLNQI